MNNKVVLITGASSGIGKELAKTFAKDNWNLILLARREELLQEIEKNLIHTYNVKINIHVCDVTNLESVKLIIHNSFNVFKHIDLVILNAGIGISVPVNNFNLTNIKKIYDTNVFGVLNIISCVLPYFLSSDKKSHIVGISSLTAYKAFPKTHPYGASKSALSAHLEGLREELIHTNIKITTICPGFIKTPMTRKNKFPMPFLMDVEKACIKIKKAIDKEKDVFNFPWQTYYLLKISLMLPKKLLKIFSKKIKI